MTRDLQRAGLEPGQQSEPTTPPPERRDNPFGLGRTSRYSTSSFASPSSTHNRASRSGSLLTSPPRDPANGSDLPSKSVPASRRASTDRYSSSYMSDLTTSGRRLTGYVGLRATSSDFQAESLFHAGRTQPSTQCRAGERCDPCARVAQHDVLFV